MVYAKFAGLAQYTIEEVKWKSDFIRHPVLLKTTKAAELLLSDFP